MLFSQKYVISETELSSKNKIDREFRMNSGNEIKRELAVMIKAGIGGDRDQFHCHANSRKEDRRHLASVGRKGVV